MTIADLSYLSDLNHSLKEKESVEEVCIANISPLEGRKRMIFGIRQFLWTLLILGILIVLQVNPIWRLSLLLLFWAAAVGIFQALEKT
jgi:hypothetical protein